ncbi:MAG: prolipoprotein diacylglyceryl transferase [Candidatus Woesearchaeota archaeon]|nr:prolipoprotein diacylglyceryl transferase [Candidatus Woesearchaeota archaeon]
MFIHNINPVLARVGFLEIRYYGAILALSVFLGVALIVHLSRKKNSGIDENILLEALSYMVLAGLAGARIAHILMHDTLFYIQNPFEIIALWHGGLAAHGAFIGGALALFLYCRKKKISFYKIADIVVIPLALGLAFGRIANFINGELYGRITSVPWAVKFPGAEGFRHPSQLYESAKNFIVFLLLICLTKYNSKKRRFKDGFIFWCFILSYSVLRFIVEFFREPDISFLGLNLGQITSIILIIASIPFLISLSKSNPKKEKAKKGKRK